MASGGSRTNVYAPVYKDFQPQVERKEEHDANILVIHLPGFPKELINITYVDSSRTIKVQAERAVEKNTRIRFNQAFPVPENCIIEKIQGTFRNDVLTITMPKNTVIQVVSVKDVSISKGTSPSTKSTKDKDQKETSPTATSTSGVEKRRDEKLQVPHQTPQNPIADEPKAPMPTPPQTASPKAKPKTNGKKAEALQSLKQQEETQKKVTSIPATAKPIEEKTAAGPSSSTAKIVEKKAESKDGLKDQVKEKDSISEAQIPKIPEKGKKEDKADDGAVEEKPKEGGGSSSSSSFLERAKEIKGMDTIMKTIKMLATDDYEDRQLLLNIGVSVLVIVALGAYITYSYRSSGKAEN